MPAIHDMAALGVLLEPLGYILEADQPHVGGERDLMSPEKLVLVGRTSAGERVVIKTSTTKNGKEEITKEKRSRDVLTKLSFANDTLLMAHELYFGEVNNRLFFITEFIEQENVFVARPLEEQFFLVLRALEAQEAFHATTFEHVQKVQHVFDAFSPETYINALHNYPEAQQLLRNNVEVLRRYNNYLIHTDFVPHNFRVRNRQIYILDQSAIKIGNKYEGWARLLNYMIIHNPVLEKILTEYVRKNRSADEYLALRLMRIYKICYLLDFYTRSLPKAKGELAQLTKKRITFWKEVLTIILADQEVPHELVEAYKTDRDSLRTEEEKHRQREFAVA